MRMRPTCAALAGLLLILGVPDAAAQVMQWQVDGETRKAIVYAPASSGAEEAPLVLAFHGFGDNMQNFQYTDMFSRRNPLLLNSLRYTDPGSNPGFFVVERRVAQSRRESLTVTNQWFAFSRSRIFVIGRFAQSC